MYRWLLLCDGRGSRSVLGGFILSVGFVNGQAGWALRAGLLLPRGFIECLTEFLQCRHLLPGSEQRSGRVPCRHPLLHRSALAVNTVPERFLLQHHGSQRHHGRVPGRVLLLERLVSQHGQRSLRGRLLLPARLVVGHASSVSTRYILR